MGGSIQVCRSTLTSSGRGSFRVCRSYRRLYEDVVSLYLTPTGLAVANVIEMEIVTADVEIRNIYESSEPNLFWAGRGGGGGTWRVVTEAVYRTRPRTALYQVLIFADVTVSEQGFNELVRQYTRFSPQIADHGTGGAGTLSSSTFSMSLLIPNTSLTFSKPKLLLNPLIDI